MPRTLPVFFAGTFGSAQGLHMCLLGFGRNVVCSQQLSMPRSENVDGSFELCESASIPRVFWGLPDSVSHLQT